MNSTLSEKKQSKFNDFNKFKNTNFISIEPSKSYSSEYSDNTEIKQYLQYLAYKYTIEFRKIGSEILESRYKEIFNEITKFINELKYYYDSYFQCLIINSDQNSETFYDRLAENFQKSDKNSNIIDPSSLDKSEKEIENVFFTINESNFDIKNLCGKLGLFPKEVSEVRYTKIEYPIRLIVVREIAKLNTIDLNSFIWKLIDHNRLIQNNQLPVDSYKNIVIFDVTHDLNSLFNKIQPDILSKMIFNNLPYTPSRFIYRNIIYKFVKDKGSIFFPAEHVLVKLLHYIDNYQLSIITFNTYFKYLIMEFFMFKNWFTCSFLIFDWEIVEIRNNPNLDDKEIKSKIKERLIYLSKQLHLNNEDEDKDTRIKKKQPYQFKVEDIITFHNDIYQSRAEFFLWFESFSKIIDNVSNKYFSIKEKDENEGIKRKFFKEEFLFRFLTLGTRTKDIYSAKTSVFIDEIIKYNNETLNEGNDSVNIVDCETFIKTVFLKEIEDALSKLKNDNTVNILKEYKENLLKNFTSSDDIFQHYDSKKFKAFKQIKKSNQYESHFTPSSLTNSSCNTLFRSWLEEFLKKINGMRWIKLYEELNTKSSNYYYSFQLNSYAWFENIVNPCFERAVINDFKLLSLHNIYEQPNTTTNITNDNISQTSIYTEKMENLKKPLSMKEKKKLKSKLQVQVELNESDSDITMYASKELNLESIPMDKIYNSFFEAFGVLGFEFRLKFFFIEFLQLIGIDTKDSKEVNINKKNIGILRNIFQKLLHELYLMGYCHRKRGNNSDVYVKNYFENKGFFEN